jgi:hypothetical protein
MWGLTGNRFRIPHPEFVRGSAGPHDIVRFVLAPLRALREKHPGALRILRALNTSRPLTFTR